MWRNRRRRRTFIAATLSLTDDKKLFLGLQAYVVDFGANMLNSHRVIEHHLPARIEEEFHFHCLPAVWVARYLSQNDFAIDPIIAAALTEGEPFGW
jgi:hypothetical protein